MVSNSLHDEKNSELVPPSTISMDLLPLVVGTVSKPTSDLVSKSVMEILRLIREELAMDMVLITMHVDDDVVITHAATAPDEPSVKGMTHPKELSICQRVLEGRLPAVIPDMAALRQTHDVPPTPIVPAAFMAVPVILRSGTRYGVLCCLKSTPMPELDECHHRRLEMSAQHIARLVDEAG